MKNNTNMNYTPLQLKIPMDVSAIIPLSSPVYTFVEVLSHIDLNQYFVDVKDSKIGRPRCDLEKMLKVLLFAFMDKGYCSLREVEHECAVNLEYMWLLDGMSVPTFATFGNFARTILRKKIKVIFRDINNYIFKKEHVDLNHVYIDGTKMQANANKYSWVWKKSCKTNRQKTFENITHIIEKINQEVLFQYNVYIEERDEYAIEYLEGILKKYCELTGVNPRDFVHGPGHKKTIEQKWYEKLNYCLERLKKYAVQLAICGEHRNSYSKTDHDASFMRVKRDYMGNDQLLAAYNMQVAICDEYIAAITALQYASDMECFVPLMQEFYNLYGFYPGCPVADAGYGSYTNYLFCEEHGMEKMMKFPTYEKTTKNETYRTDPFRSVNFERDEEGNPVCPNGKRFFHKSWLNIKGNKYGRKEEVFECEDCSECPYRKECYKGAAANRTIRLNEELTQFHSEVVENLGSIRGALLRMNRSIQAEGVFGIMKWDRAYNRVNRRGLENVIFEFTLISCGFNLYKFHNKMMKARQSA